MSQLKKNILENHFKIDTLQGNNISPKNGILKMIFLFPRWDMLIPWRVSCFSTEKNMASTIVEILPFRLGG